MLYIKRKGELRQSTIMQTKSLKLALKVLELFVTTVTPFHNPSPICRLKVETQTAGT